MKKKIYLLILSTAFFVSCTVTLPVQASTSDGKEAFTGTATGGMDGSGTIFLKSNKGLIVTGDFVYINSRQGSGVFTTNDGRTGPFNFVSTGMRGNGTGIIGNQNITFSFGPK